jgi:chromosome partitioning protein
MKPYIITIAGQKGGAGKSTIAAHLSAFLSQLNLQITLIDIDPQQTLTKWKTIREKNYECKTNINFIQTNGLRLGNELIKLNNTNIAIIDSPPHMDSETKSAIRLADLVIIPCQPSPNDLWATNTTINWAEKEKKKFIIVLNRCSYHSKLLKEIKSNLPNDIDKYLIGNRIIFANSMLYGSTASETEPLSSAAKEISIIADAILREYNKKE